jgi:biopolymer transport protein ExbD
VDEPLINLTPLIDVVFVILIGFIIIAPILDRDRVELAGRVADPDRVSDRSRMDSPIHIKVLADNSIWLRGQQVEAAQLQRVLLVLKEAHPGTEPVLVHDRRASFGTYQEVKTACERAGFSNLDVILKPQ